MKNKLNYISIYLLMLCSSVAYGADCAVPADSIQKQKREMRNKHPLKRFYGATGSELIFSYSSVLTDSFNVQPKVRFSLFPHIQQQAHYNFNKRIGFYTGASLINVGFKNLYTAADTLNFELRQRSMSFGIPLALKLGNMEKGNYFAIGACAEFMFHYKYKLYYNNEKVKYSDWFSDQVNLFNPSVFLDIRNKRGGYVRFKYYLNNFLPEQSHNYLLPESGLSIDIKPNQSMLFYVAIGSTFMKKKPRKLTLDDV